MSSDIEMVDESGGNIYALASVFTITFILGLFFLQLISFPVNEAILETQVQIIDSESSRAQRLFYIALLGMFATICAALLLWPSVRISPKPHWGNQVLLMVVVISAMILGSWSKQFLFGFILVAVFVILSRTGVFHYVSRTWLNSDLRQNQKGIRVLFWLLVAATFFYLVVFLLGPLSTPLLISTVAEMMSVEGHYAVTVLPGFDLLCCAEVGTIEHANYGLAMPLLSALALKVLHFFGISDAVLTHAVKLNQFIAAALICILSFLTNRKHFSHVMALALGMTAYTLSNVGDAVGYPNQSGIRYIPILISLYVLVFEVRRVQIRVWFLASTAALFVIMSPETGLASTAGFIVATVLKKYEPERAIASVAAVVILFGSIFITTGVAWSVMIAGPILNNSSAGLFQFVSLFTAGDFGGMVEKPSITASLVFFAAAFSVLRGVWHARSDLLSSSDTYEAAVGTIMLVWLTYYVNRMAEWNLWFQLVLLTFLIAPHINSVGWQNLARKPILFGITRSMIIACLIGGQLAYSADRFSHQAANWLRWQRLGCDQGIVTAGMCLPWLSGSKFELQINALTKGYSPAETLVLTGVSTYARLHGFNEGFPWYDTGEIVYKKDVDVIVNWMELHGPRYIVADDPSYEIARSAPKHSQQIQSYLSSLNSYREVRRDSGWIILERLMIQPNSPHSLQH